MSIAEIFKTALIGLLTNRIRSVLTILGIVIGIASVILVMSLGEGAKKMILSQISGAGANNIFIEPGSFDPKKTSMMEASMEEFEVKTLKYGDSLAIEKDPTIELAAPFAVGFSHLVYKNTDLKIMFNGTTPSVQKIYDSYPVLGRFFTEGEVKSKARVAVLGYKIKEDLFGEENPLGKIARIKKTNFQIIGVMEKQGMQMFQNLDANVYLPLTAAQQFLLGADHIRWLIVKAKNEKVVDEAVRNIRLILRERHNIHNPGNDLGKDDFRVMSQVEATKMLSAVTGILTVLLSSIAAVALIVGGIGIMNIMLVSVTERTREIGLRKAVGARKEDILKQFLLEAVILTVLGGAAGILLGITLSFGASKILSNLIDRKWYFVVSLNSVFLGFGVAAAVGLIFGLYPAQKASKLDPIEALRYE